MKKPGIIVFCLFTFFSNAQESQVDTLFEELDKQKDNYKKVKLLHKIISLTWDFSFERAKQFAQLELELANKIADPEALTIANTDMGMYYYFVGDYDQAADFYQKGMKAAGNQDFGEFPAYTITRIGNLFKVQGQYDSAFKYYKITEELLASKPKGVALASVYFHHGWSLAELSRYEESLQYLYKARNIRYQLGDSLLIAECWRVMSAVHLGLTNMDSTRWYLDKVMRIAKGYGDTELVILTSINLGDYFLTKGETVSSIQAYETALDSLTHHDFKRYRALALQQIGRVFDNRGDHLKAMDYYFEALRLSEELNSKHEIARIHGYMGWAQISLKNFSLAKEQAQLCFDQMQSINDLGGMAFAYNLIGQLEFSQSNYPAALTNYDSAFRLRQQLKLTFMASNTKFNIARTYEKLGRLDDALRYYLEDLEVAKELKNYGVLALSYNNIGWLYARKRNFKKADEYLSQGQKLSLQHGNPSDIRDNYLYFAMRYGLAGQEKKSNEYYQRYVVANDSLLIEENALAVQQRDAIYQLEKKNQEIRILNERNLLREGEIQAHKSQIVFQNLILILSLLALVLISVVAYVLYRYNKAKSAANEALNNLNRSILEQKEEIQSQAEELIEANQTISEINKTLEEKVTRRTQQLNQAFSELDTFIYKSSHDLRRPLTTFMGLAEVARISVKDTMAIELFDKVSDTARNLDRMLAKLQAVSQIGSSDLSIRKIFMDSEVDHVFDQYRETILEKRIRIEKNIGLNGPLLSYPTLIRIILENLVENSIYFSHPENAFVRVDVKNAGPDLMLKVEDNGEGIGREFQNRLFEMYFRANERSKGNGLGLYLVKRASEKLNGKVEFSEREAGGSIFTVTVPFQSVQ